MTDSRPTYRLFAALVALLFALGWAVPVVNHACALPSASPMQCDHRRTAQHCDAEAHPSAVCLSHHANQDALVAQAPVPDVSPVASALEGSARHVLTPLLGDNLLASFSRRTVFRADRLHTRVGVWLE